MTTAETQPEKTLALPDAPTLMVFGGFKNDFPGMGLQTWTEFEAAKKVYIAAEAALGHDFTEYNFGSKTDLLAEDPKLAGVASAVAGVAEFAAFEEQFEAEGQDLPRIILSGLSMGLITACIAGGMFDSYEAGFDFIDYRLQAMVDNAKAGQHPGTVVAVLGLGETELQDAIDDVETDKDRRAWIAIQRDTTHFAIAGSYEGVQNAADQARELGGKVRETGIPFPAHTVMQADAERKIKDKLGATELRKELNWPFLSTGDVPRIITSARQAADYIVEMTTRPVYLRRAAEHAANLGVKLVVELEPSSSTPKGAYDIASRITKLKLPDGTRFGIIHHILQQYE